MSHGNLFRRLLNADTPDDLWRVTATLIDSRACGHGDREAAAVLNAADSVVLFGAGEYARAVLSAWTGSAISPCYLVDSNCDKWGKSWCGLPVLSPEELAKDPRKPLVVIAAMNTHAIESRLDAMRINPIFSERDGTVGFMPGHWLASHQESFGEIYNALADDQSREVLLAVTKARLFQSFHFPMKGNWFTVECATHPQYFPGDIIELREGETFVDCGAYDGDTIIDFASWMWRGRISRWRAIAFEADAENARITRGNLDDFGLNSVPVIQGALGAETQTDNLPLHNCRGGVAAVDVPRIILDDVLQDFAPTFIKMDIEGAELGALKSAVHVLSENAPRLATCIYHQSSDLIEIPQYINKNFPFYKLYIRHHSCGSLWETVCYAISG